MFISKSVARVSASIALVLSIGIAMVMPAFAASSNCATTTAPSAAIASSVTTKAYQDWKQTYVVSAGSNQLRVQRSAGDNYDTVSEGIAYGMLFAAYSNDKTTFDGLWRYVGAHTNNNGFMNWRIAADGSTTGYNGATDADEDMAAALVAADAQWSGYKTDAQKQINLIKKYEVEAGTNVLKPGDAWGGSDLLNPSYLTPSYYGVFAQYTGDSSWNNVRNASYQILNAIKTNTASRSTGYIPDWSTASGYRANGMGYEYGYDGSRLPLRLALASSWDCDANVTDSLATLNNTNQKLNLSNLARSYNLDGSVAANGDGTPLLAAAAAAATISNNDAYRASTWNALSDAVSKKDYFSDSMRVLGLFIAGGLLTNPLSLPTATPIATAPEPVVTSPKSYAISSSDVTVSTGTSATATVMVVGPAAINNTIVDLEVYDAQGNRVAQKFYDNQGLTPAASSYSVAFTPSNNGTYTVRGGVFTANWSNNLVWNNSISKVTATTVESQPPTTVPVQAPTPTLPVAVQPPATPVVIATPPATPAPTPIVVTTPAPPSTPVVTTPPAMPVTPVAPTPVQAAPTTPPTAPVQTTTTPQANTTDLSIWWPSNGQTVRGIQPFKAVLDGMNSASYTMYWQVDGGTLNLLSDNNADAPHKESLVDVSSWNWRSNQIYTLNFIAKNTAGDVIAQKSTTITVGH